MLCYAQRWLTKAAEEDEEVGNVWVRRDRVEQGWVAHGCVAAHHVSASGMAQCARGNQTGWLGVMPQWHTCASNNSESSCYLALYVEVCHVQSVSREGFAITSAVKAVTSASAGPSIRVMRKPSHVTRSANALLPAGGSASTARRLPAGADSGRGV